MATPKLVALDPRLVALGFSPIGAQRATDAAGKPRKRRLFVTIEGPPATGKTDFIRRCPWPQVVVDFDKGMEGVAETDIEGRPIMRRIFDTPDLDQFGKTASQGERDLALRVYAEFKKLVHDTMASGAARTLVIETGTAAYALAQIARFGQIAQLGEVPASMWTSMQAEFESIFLEYERYDCNLIVTHRQGTKFKSLIGETELKGYKPMQYLSQVHLDFQKRAVKDAKGKTIDFELVREIRKCRQRIALESPGHPSHEFPVVFLDDEKIESVGGDFLTIAQAVLPNSAESDWV